MKKNSKHTKATKRKMSDAQMGKKNPSYGKTPSDATRKKISDAKKGKLRPDITGDKNPMYGVTSPNKGKKLSEYTKQKISESSKDKKHSESTKKKMSGAHKGLKASDKTKKRMSATQQGIPYDEWESFACEKKYCPKFDEACRESCRAKYNYRCFMCDKKEADNKTKSGKIHKLSVHHVDMDKAQGCESNWKLVPLCKRCHATAHNDEIVARLGYLIKGVKNK